VFEKSAKDAFVYSSDLVIWIKGYFGGFHNYPSLFFRFNVSKLQSFYLIYIFTLGRSKLSVKFRQPLSSEITFDKKNFLREDCDSGIMAERSLVKKDFYIKKWIYW